MCSVKRSFQGSKGFTITEVLVSITIFLVVSLGIAGVMKNYLESERNNDGRASLDRVSQVISNRLYDEDYCTGKLAGKSIGVNDDSSNSLALDLTNAGLGRIPSPEGKPILGFGVAIQSFRFTNQIQQNTLAGPNFFDTDGNTWFVWRVNPIIKAYVPNPRGGADTGTKLQDREMGSILVMVSPSDNSTIHGCMSEARFRTAKCAAVGKFFNPIGNRPVPFQRTYAWPLPAVDMPTAEAPDIDGCVSKKAFSGHSFRGDSIQGIRGNMGPIGPPGPPGPPGSPGPPGG